MNSNTSMIKTVALWVVIALIGVMLFHLFNQPTKQTATLSFSEFLKVLDKGELKEVTIQGNEIKGTLVNGKLFDSYTPDDPKLVERLTAKNVSIIAKPKDESPWYLSALISWIPMLSAHRCLGPVHEADANRRDQGHELWQEQGQAHDPGQDEGHLC